MDKYENEMVKLNIQSFVVCTEFKLHVKIFL